jgi:hypothetical protein
VTLQYSGEANGPWQTIAARVENNGRYAWRYDAQTPDKIFLRLEVRDEAGNIGVSQSIEPISLERTNPAGKLQQVRPVTEGTNAGQSNSPATAKPVDATAANKPWSRRTAAEKGAAEKKSAESDSNSTKTQVVENPFFKSSSPLQNEQGRPGLYR